MQTNGVLRRLIVCSCVWTLAACSGGSQSEIAENLRLNVTANATVLPSELSETSTCTEGGVKGPRVRLRVGINWPASMATKYGNLVPLVMSLVVDNPRLDPKENVQTLSSTGDFESIVAVFGINPNTTDFVPPDGNTYSSGDTISCYADYGSLPKPKTELKGAQQLKVLATIRLSGVTRLSDGTESPFIKEIKTNLVYSAGSVPIE